MTDGQGARTPSCSQAGGRESGLRSHWDMRAHTHTHTYYKVPAHSTHTRAYPSTVSKALGPPGLAVTPA